MSQQIYNVYPNPPAIAVSGWQEEADLWIELNKEVGGFSEFNPLTIKARYITGIIWAACESVTILLDGKYLIETTYYPAYAVFASAVELLGRCINGNKVTHNANLDLKTGFRWLATRKGGAYQPGTDDHIVVVETTANYKYSIKELANLRHFSAHGQGGNQNVSIGELRPLHNLPTPNQGASRPTIKDFDYLILGKMPPLIGDGMEAYLTELKSNEDLANNLTSASITPYRNAPIRQSMQGPAYADTYPASIGEVLRGMDWTYKPWRLKLT